MSESTIFMKLSLSTKHDLLASGVSFRQSTAKNGGAIALYIHAFLNYILTLHWSTSAVCGAFLLRAVPRREQQFRHIS